MTPPNTAVKVQFRLIELRKEREMEIPRELLVILVVFGLFLLVDLVWNVLAFRRLWRIRRGFIGDLRGALLWAKTRALMARDRFRAWHDPEFRKMWLAFGDYQHCFDVIDRLRRRAEQHYIRSEQSSFELVRRHHAALHTVMEAKVPEVAEAMAYYIAGMSDEEIGYVADALSGMVVDPKIVTVSEDDRVPIGADRFAEFLRSERDLLLREPRLMETHADRLAEFVQVEAEAVRRASDAPEACDASAT